MENRIAELKAELALLEAQERASKGLVKCSFKTNAVFDSRKHGHAYVAIVAAKDGKVEREFLNSCLRVYDTKHKYYAAKWEVELEVGTKIEARLEDGSWKNDYRVYFIVEQNGLREVGRAEVLGI